MLEYEIINGRMEDIAWQMKQDGKRKLRSAEIFEIRNGLGFDKSEDIVDQSLLAGEFIVYGWNNGPTMDFVSTTSPIRTVRIDDLASNPYQVDYISTVRLQTADMIDGDLSPEMGKLSQLIFGENYSEIAKNLHNNGVDVATFYHLKPEKIKEKLANDQDDRVESIIRGLYISGVGDHIDIFETNTYLPKDMITTAITPRE